nr:uncharacterized protein LOC128689306 [Cherax quadricarinatus]
MEENKDDQDGLPEIYLSLSHGPKGERDSTRASSDTDQNAGNDTDSDVWTALLPEVTTTGYFELSQEISMAQQEQYSFSLGVREEIEGVSSQDSSAAGNILANRTPVLYGGILNANQSERNEDASCSISQPGETEGKNIVAHRREVVEGSGQRGETPGSDCPPVAGVGAFSRVFMQPLKLDTNFNATSNNELIFSPGGDEGIMLPGGVHAYYDSGSDTEPLEWGTGGEDESEALSQVRDAVEGADSGTPSIQASLGNISPNELEDMERNSPAGLSTPDTDLDLNVAATNNLENQKLKNSVRPPVVGQSEELLVQTLRKDLGSTDGEESEDESQKRLPLKSAKDAFSTPDFQPGSLGSQSENTDSVNTVLDMSRGEIQGCETDETLDTPLLSPSIVTESLAQSCPKPTFVVGGLISPRVKFRQFQNTVRDRMQDMKASLELQPGIDSQVHVDRDQFLSQPPLYPPNTSISEQEISLTSMISVDSTNHPDSSERVTSPSALSVSSAASSRKMEWDSGADVGYSGNLTGNTQEHLVTSLSTLERIAIGNYASVLRTEPEGTTQVKEKQKASKKSAKSNSTKLGNNSNVSRQVLVEGVTLSPSRSLRLQQTRDKINLSSSDEDFDSKLSSPAQSPRRRLRRRSLITISKDMESPSRKMNKGQQGPNRRLVEVTQELHNEGKSSSLVELASTSVKVPEYKRSSSQQSLSLQGRPESNTNVKSNMSAAEGSVSSVTTAVYQNNKLEPFLGASSIVNITTSTGSIIQNVLPIPQVGVSTSTQQYAKEKKDDFKSVNEDTKSSPQSSLQSTESQTNIHGRTGTSSGNDFSSKSHDSSDMETPSDMKDTDANSYTSYQLSDVELVNLKAKKNSENAKSHENIAKKCRSRVKSTDHNNWKDSNDSNSWSSSLQVEGQRGSPQDSESVLESQVSLQSSNNYLHALSVKLKERIHVLLDNGSLKKVQDYNKLQDYIQFIGVPSTNEEECRLKQGVANVIVRMFGEIGLDDTDTSNTFTNEASEILTTDSQTSDQRPHTTSEHTSVGHEDTDVPSSHGMLEAEDFHQCGITADNEMPVTTRSELCVNTGSTVTIVPYRPLSATRTYFMAVSHERDEGLVEGEQHIHTPERGSPAVLTPNSDLEVSRGQAEGQLQHEELSVSLPSAHQVVPCQNNDTIVDCNSEEPVSLAVVNDPSVKTSGMSKNQTEEPGSASGAATLPHDWGFDLRAGKIQGTSSRGVTSDECSPRHTGHRLAWDRRSSWHEEDQGQGCRDSVNWWSSTTRSERLYKDKRGTLHVAKQPPGYMDDHDSHPSESTSDHDHHHPENNDTESQEDTRRGPVRPWTSSGSESAYETIRERHRHVDEALASSFEFYSTSPRDARLLGYVSSDAGEQGQEYEDHLQREPSPELPPPPTPPLSEGSQESPQPPSPPLSEQPVSSRSARTKRHASRWQQQQLTDRQNSSPSSHTDGNDVSSQVSFIHLQKQRYVRKIQRHILTLEKLERALLEQLGDSIGSSSSFRRHVTEGHSRTESDTNAKSQIRDILGQSGTTASSIISSDFSDGAVQKEPYQPCPRERVSKNDLIGVKPVSQESPSHSAERSESTKSVTGHSTFERSHTSSRMTFSQLSSDLTSSRASTMKYIEEEVKKLVLTEERSRQMMKNSRLHSQKTRREDLDFQGAIRKMRRKEPRGEDDPVHSQLSNKRRTSDDILDYKLYVKNRILKECVMLDSKVTAGSKDSSRQFTQPCVISEEEFTDRAISDSQISRQGDGREARDQNQGIRVSPVIYKEDATNSTLLSSPVRERNSQSQNEHLRKKLLRDFGQMFPSRENVLLSECENRSENVIGHSVGVQTSDSLLYLSRSSRQSKGSSSSRPSSGTTSDKSESLNNASSRGKRMSSKSGSGKDQNEKCFSDEKQVLESVSQRVNKVKADEQASSNQDQFWVMVREGAQEMIEL